MPKLTPARFEKVANECVERFLKMFSLKDWSVEVYVGACADPSHQACVQIESNYMLAAITFDPAAIASLEQLEQAALHEVLHIVLSPYETYPEAMGVITDPYLPPNMADSIQALSQTTWTRSAELVTTRLERVLYPLVGKYVNGV